MRLSIHREIDAIRRQLRLGRRRVALEQLQQYAAEGTLPSDPLTAAYVRLTRAALAAMNASVAGDHEAACEQYEAALAEWQNEVKGPS